MKCVSTKMLFHEMQEKHDEDKASKPQLLILSVGRIGQQDPPDISEDCSWVENNSSLISS